MSATPTPYDRQANFVTDAQGNANITVSQIATKLDSEFDAINVSLDQTQSRLGEIQRDDGALKNNIVTASALTVDVRNKLVSGDNAYRGLWQTGIRYFPGDVAYKDLSLYYCQVEHVASDFTADLTSGDWSIAVANTISDTSDPNAYVPLTRWSLTPNGSTTGFTITGTTVTNSAAYLVTIDGVLQDPASYTITTNTITFSEAPPSGSAVIVVGIAYAKGVLADAVNTAALVDGAVTTAKIADGSIIPAKLSSGHPNWDASGNLTVSGNVGIGKSSPEYKLDVSNANNTTIHVMGDTSGVRVGTSVDTPVSSAGYVGTYSNHPLALGINNSEKVRIDSSGNVGIGTSSPQGRLSVSNGGASGLELFANYIGGGIGTYIQSFNRGLSQFVDTAYAAASHAFCIGGDEKVRIDSSGNVGIGTSSPIVKLDVAGSGNFSGSYATVSVTSPDIPLFLLKNTAAPADKKYFRIGENSDGIVIFERVNDSYSATSGVFQINTDNSINQYGNPIKNCPTTAKAWVNFNGNALGSDYTSGNTITYAVSGSVTNVTITRASHTIGAGWFVTVSGVTGATGVNGTYRVTSVTGTQIVYQVPSVVTGTVAGTAVVRPTIINGTPYNVSSITKTGTGAYQVNYTTAMGDANYSLVASAGEPSTGILIKLVTLNTSNASISTLNSANSAIDTSLVCAQVFGN